MRIFDKFIRDARTEEEACVHAEAEVRGVSVAVVQLERNEERARVEEHQRIQDQQQACERNAQIKAEHQCRLTLGERFGLDVAVHIGHIVKLSGLSERGAGNGWDKATVWHVVFDESYTKGRLKRQAGDLLCKPSNTLGSRSMGVTGTAERGERHVPATEFHVTCKACLERLKSLP